jgi:hypothetical protein
MVSGCGVNESAIAVSAVAALWPVLCASVFCCSQKLKPAPSAARSK